MELAGCPKATESPVMIHLQGWPTDATMNNDGGIEDAPLPKSSFRDKVVGNKANRLQIPEDLVAKKLVHIEYREGNRSLSKITEANSIMK